ncbi:DnaJ homolog subfamily C member 24-like Protein [Tribolium castaneum]|uniref:DnaJ homolog subfamily C member 24-like Protein n=1 Tax=Tribolium castaneum TaxID=7070 RepID=D2A368_TRICA|nr:PREDICTED: dnaJ homolog subfamily C member 24 [Tribolium castaneum]XP_008191857.1 PREDICTED: dnaJ homolog subfamily C member 24 [Tribolium castaneum]XP_015834776.1 PREDICTED: dnaJ homolog subfamily C member 24 [Tribolium castaneum]EFA02269.1 DnaJ homolog subfamily C member 24-like Protein [Tribolium castaneum]|eukprot:XP_008191856.1 PREDICTED: dnaJ homolog subfamily C member 24 [Tribolium castaneum]
MTTQARKEDYYSLLNCSRSATYEELKQSYQQLIRQYHPDKSGGSQENFLNIDKAWKTLKNENSRAEYDRYLDSEIDNENGLVHIRLNKTEISFNFDNIANYSCRCGGTFTIHKEYLDEEECLVECNDCSNYLLIK